MKEILKGLVVAALFATGILLGIAHSNNQPLDPCSKKALELYAPETLEVPRMEDFGAMKNYGSRAAYINRIQFYNAALNQFITNGTWASLEDGTKCNLN